MSIHGKKYLAATILSGAVWSLWHVGMASEPADKRVHAAALAAEKLGSSAILQVVVHRDKVLNRVTDKPFTMDIDVSALCRMPFPADLPVENPHRGHMAHVYASTEAAEPLRTGQGSYPVGSFIIKEKLPGLLELLKPVHANAARDGSTSIKQSPQPELFTAMLKREPGYNPDCGDWEFLVIDGRATQVLARGKIESCMDCHKDYKATDYVTRAYLPASK